ncbi:MAG: S-methyl-5-thioribose-1-phosphate isomerase [Candidatus Micrarchaeota archaeon]|nr:S-methyl-5-thioribose-1-phosphate isomerase [Candidatus Micrarchaeota archaeon]MBU1681776.1 S-methyl-5-thioribose-1-phosphate isomerase [Candidatus Micrarchaeota archaeon]
MHREVTKIIKDIKSLKIQGARNVAKASLKALIIVAKNSKAKTTSDFIREFADAEDKLSVSRPTEPMMRNLLRESLIFAEESAKKKTLVMAKKAIVSHEKMLIKKMESDAEKLATYGAKLIPDNALVLTHCHSSTVTRILITAKKLKKKFKVVSFETRPRYQGRKTAKELADSGIDVTLAVDGAMEMFMRKADIVLVGADSITSRGDLINKIGTSTLAHIAKMNDVSFYCAAELSKYSPKTMFGTREEIEERDPKEVWERPPKKVKIRNPAFEATAAKYINGFVTEVGIIPSQSFFAVATEKLGIKLYE